MKLRILALDDDQNVLNSFSLYLKDTGYELDIVKDPREALELIRRYPMKYAIAFIDYNLSTKTDDVFAFGDHVAKQIKIINEKISVMMMSGDETPKAFKAWLAAGVDQFLYKPIKKHEIIFLVENAFEKFQNSIDGKTKVAPEIPQKDKIELAKKTGLFGRSDAIAQVSNTTLKFASSDCSVLLLGESGTGKELAAKAIHKNSKRSAKPFLAINCSGFNGNEQLFDSEFFGYEKASFTGAEKSTIGIFETASGGTVFLDELNQLSLNAQNRLLRVLQEKKIRRVGGKSEYTVDFRLIAATKPNLRELAAKNLFSPDLYYRICVLELGIPALRDRVEDIPPLISHFQSEIEKRDNKSKNILDATMSRLLLYNWPGNVRELQSLIEALYVNVDKKDIRIEDLPAQILNGETQNDLLDLEIFFQKQDQELGQRIIAALKKTGENVSRAATLLNIPRSTLKSLIKRLRIKLESVESQLDLL